MLQIKQFTFSPLSENTCLLYNEEGQACIIDPGAYFPAEKETLQAFIESHKLQVTHLLLTHAHLDHVFALAWAAQTYALQPMMHAAEQPVLDRGAAMGAAWGLPFPPYEGPVQYIAEHDEIKLGNDSLTVIYAPGHSPGHVCYHCAAQQFVVGGDVLFRGSIGRTDLPGGNHQQLLQSIRTKLFVLPPETVVYCGHGPETTIGDEMADNPFF